MELEMTVQEVAKHFGRSTEAVYRWTRIGFLTPSGSRQTGGLRRVTVYRRSDVLALKLPPCHGRHGRPRKRKVPVQVAS